MSWADRVVRLFPSFYPLCPFSSIGIPNVIAAHQSAVATLPPTGGTKRTYEVTTANHPFFSLPFCLSDIAFLIQVPTCRFDMPSMCKQRYCFLDGAVSNAITMPRVS